MTQPGKFDLGGPGFLIGRSGGEPVSDEYPGESSSPFTGGTIKRLLVDVSGEPFADLARDAAAAYARQWPLIAASHNLLKLHNHWIAPATG